MRPFLGVGSNYLTKLHIGNWKKAHLRHRYRMTMNLPSTRDPSSSLHKQTLGVDTAHTLLRCFFLFYSKKICILTLANQLQWPTKQLAVLQIVKRVCGCLQHSGMSPADLIHTNKYVTVTTWFLGRSYLLGLLEFSLRVTPFPGKYPSITAGRHCKVLQSRGDVKNGKTLVAAIIAPCKSRKSTSRLHIILEVL